jgi:hypothetical protein
LIIESISLKLVVDLLTYLQKSRLYATNIKILFFDGVLNEYATFQDLPQLASFFEENYKFLDDCQLGNLCSISAVSFSSDLYNFETSYQVSDVTGVLKIVPGKSYDRDRNSQQTIFIERQVSYLNNTISEYLSFFAEINRIYKTGIYAPCYAVPGWVQNTWYLSNLKLAYLGNRSFLFNELNIQKTPPN